MRPSSSSRPVLFAAILAALLIPTQARAGGARSLTFSERVAAQGAIERVYYAHQIGATRSFEVAVPAAVLEAKVRTYLEQSAALETIWKTRVTARALERELDRIAERTRYPDRLEEIYAALGHDPFLILECFARPSLAGRLQRSFLEKDERFSGGDSWREIRTRVDGSSVAAAADPSFLLPRPGSRARRSGGSCAPDAIPLTAPSTGTAVCVPDDTWDNGSLDDVPDPRDGHTAIWTGSVMVAWGGCCWLGSGGRYDPLTDTWSPVSAVNAPGPRSGHAAVWTGSYMVVWGGEGDTANPEWFQYGDGRRYDPIADVWLSMSASAYPRTRPTAVWTGREVLVWGGYTGRLGIYFDDGFRYDPATDTASSVSTTDAPSGRAGHVAAWTGSEMLVWGGGNYSGELATGGRYDPATDSWRDLAAATSSPPPSETGIAAWSGDRMFLWLGRSDQAFLYDPNAEDWSPASTLHAPTPRDGATVVWTGREFVVWGGSDHGAGLATGGRYDPRSDSWTTVSALNAPPGRGGHAAVWTGDRMLVWSGGFLPSGGRYDPSGDSWTPIAETQGPAARSGHSAIWTGNVMIVWGGTGATRYLGSGGRYDPLLDAWSPTSLVSAPAGRSGHSAVWTGDRMIVWGGLVMGPFFGEPTRTGGIYDPSADAWTPTATLDAPPSGGHHAAVWTGRRMVVWNGDAHAGGRYDPAADLWSDLSTNGAPTAVSGYSAVWTGSSMLVWGGIDSWDDIASETNAGAAYDPAADHWSPLETVNAPEERTGQAAVWTGTRMIVTGGTRCFTPDGYDYYCFEPGTDGAYDPATDAWAPLPGIGRIAPSAVWTGVRLITWGGARHVLSNPLYTTFAEGGFRLDPVSGTGSPLSTAGQPPPRVGNSAVWTGDFMILWGGTNGFQAAGFPSLQTGARYRAGAPRDGDGDGYTACDGDCDDTNEDVHPGAVELPGNAVDENCDGVKACDPAASWKDHGTFVGCVARECGRLVDSRLASRRQCDTLISGAAQSAVGRR